VDPTTNTRVGVTIGRSGGKTAVLIARDTKPANGRVERTVQAHNTQLRVVVTNLADTTVRIKNTAVVIDRTPDTCVFTGDRDTLALDTGQIVRTGLVCRTGITDLRFILSGRASQHKKPQT
jgi:hypothetical protein